MKNSILTDWELWACANESINQHGADASIFAALRADELAEAGDEDGARNWRLIVQRINRLQEAPGSSVN